MRTSMFEQNNKVSSGNRKDLMAAASEQRRTKNLEKEDHFAEAGLLDIPRC